jgi:hemoglobin
MTTVYEHAGGEAAFQALAAAHHQRCLDDPVLSHPFSHGGHPEHVARLGWYLAEVFGGPPLYSRRCGDHSFVLEMHAHQGMDDDLGERFVRCFVAAADDAGLPDDLAFREVLHDYMHWATDEVLSYDAPDTVVERLQPVPHWSWDGLQR